MAEFSGKLQYAFVFPAISKTNNTQIIVRLGSAIIGKTSRQISFPKSATAGSVALSFFSLCINSATGTRTRVARVRAEYPNQLDYSGLTIHENILDTQCLLKYSTLSYWDHPAAFTRTLECRSKHIITMSLLHEVANVKTYPNHFLCI